jgi:hypothetical protein
VPDLSAHAPTPDGGQRSPGPLALLKATGNVLRTLPGMAVTTAKYLRHRHAVDHEVIDLEGPAPDPDPDRAFPGDPSTVLRRSAGHGPLYRRTYRVEVEDARTGPEELIGRLLVDPNRASPTEVSMFEAVHGTDRGLGAEFLVHMPGPWDAPVRVVERTATSFRFATLRGHMEAGEIEFRAAWGDGGRLVFEIESWARSGDRLYDWIYDKVPITREMQLHMWVHVLEQVAVMAGGTPRGQISVTTSRWKAAARG